MMKCEKCDQRKKRRATNHQNIAEIITNIIVLVIRGIGAILMKDPYALFIGFTMAVGAVLLLVDTI